MKKNEYIFKKLLEIVALTHDIKIYSLTFHVIIIVLSELQFPLLLIKNLVDVIESKKSNILAKLIQKFVNLITLDSLLVEFTRNQYKSFFVIIFCVSAIILFSMIICILTLLCIKKYRLFTSILVRYLSIGQILHKHIIFFYISNWTIQYLYLYYLNSNINTIQDSIYFVLSIFISKINLILGLFFQYFMSNYIKGPNDTGYLNTLDLRYSLIFKFILSFIDFVQINQETLYIFLVLIIILALIRIIILYYHPPYYHPKLLSMALCFSSITLILSVLLLVLHLIKSNLTQTTSNFYMLTLVFLLPLWYQISYQQSTKLYYNRFIQHKPKTESDYILKFTFFENMMDHGYESNYPNKNIYIHDIMIYGIIQEHLDICLDCCRKEMIMDFLNMIIQDKQNAYDEIKHHILISLLDKSIQDNPKSIRLVLHEASYFIYSRSNFNRAILLIQKVDSKHLSFSEQATIKILKNEIDTKHESLDKQTILNISKIQLCEDFYKNFLNILKFHSDKCIQFWSKFNDNAIDIKGLIDNAIDIYKHNNKIKKIWDFFDIEYSEFYIKPLLAYSNFLILVKNQLLLGQKLLDKYHKIKINLKIYNSMDGFNNQNIFNESNMLFTVAAQKEKIGNIISCSHSVLQTLGYTNAELINKNLSCIMPDCLKQLHNVFMIKYLETGQSTFINESRIIYAKHKNGYLISLHIYVKMIPAIESNITFLGLMRYRKSFPETLIVNSNGIIEDGTQQILEELNIPLANIKNFNVLDLCLTSSLKNNSRELDDGPATLSKRNKILTGFSTNSNFSSSKQLKFPNIKLQNEDIYNKIPEEGALLTFCKVGIQGNDPFRIIPSNALFEYFVTRKKEVYDAKYPLIYLFLEKQKMETINLLNLESPLHTSSSKEIINSPNNNIIANNQLSNNGLIVPNEIRKHFLDHCNAKSEYLIELESSIHDELKMPTINTVKFKNELILELPNQDEYSKNMINFDNNQNYQNHNNNNTNNNNNNKFKIDLISYENIDQQQSFIQQSFNVDYLTKNYKGKVNINNNNNNNNNGSPKNYKSYNSNYVNNNIMSPCGRETVSFLHQSYKIKSDEHSNSSMNININNNNNNNMNQGKKVVRFEVNKNKPVYYTKHDSQNFNKFDLNNEAKKSSMKYNNQLHLFKQLEEALEKSYQPKILKFKLKSLLVIHIIALIFIITVNLFDRDSIFKAQYYLKVCDTSIKRLTNYAELGRRIRIAYGVQKNVVSRTKYGSGSDVMVLMSSAIPFTLGKLEGNNTLLQTEISSLPLSSQQRFYDNEISLIDYTANQNSTLNAISLNVFEAIDNIYIQGKRLSLYMVNSTKQDLVNSIFDFLIRNTFGELLIALKDSTLILQYQIMDVLYLCKRQSTYFLIAITILLVVVYILIVNSAIRIYKKNKQLMQNLIKFKNQIYEQEIKNINKFLSMQKLDEFSYRNYEDIELDKKALTVKQTGQKKDQKIFNHSVKTTKLKIGFVLYLVQFFVSMMVIIGIFSLKIKLSSTIYSEYNAVIARLNEAGAYFFYQNVLSASVYELFALNGTTYVMDMPILDSMKQNLNKISVIDGFMLNFRDENGNFIIGDYEFVFTGNFCITTPPSTQSACITAASGAVTQGIRAMMSINVDAFSSTIQCYETSNKSYASFSSCLNLTSLKQYDSITNYLIQGFDYLFKVISQEFYSLGYNKLEILNIWCIISGLLILFGGLILCYPTQIKLLNETNKIKKTIGIFPKSFILNDAFIYNFIAQTSEGILISWDRYNYYLA